MLFGEGGEAAASGERLNRVPGSLNGALKHLELRSRKRQGNTNHRACTSR